MVTHVVRGVGALLSTAGLGIAATTHTATDWAGVAAFVTSVSGLLATIGAIWIQLNSRRGRRDRAEELMIEMLREQYGRTDQPAEPDPSATPQRRRRRDRPA